MTPHEQWAETEAQHCDKLAEAFLNCAKDWHAKGVSLHCEDWSKMVMVCTIKANCYHEMASQLRVPYRCRLEQESRS